MLINDEFTNPTKRRAMMEKRMRKVAGIEAAVLPPVLWGPRDADVTLIGWGSTKGVIEEACEILTEQGISASQLQIRWPVMTRVANCRFFKIADGAGGHTQVLALFDRSETTGYRGTDARQGRGVEQPHSTDGQRKLRGARGAKN